jgi:hypothetical protein
MFWLLRPHGDLRLVDAAWALAIPVTYCAYALARGAADGWYAYHFLDPLTLSRGALAGNIAGLCAAFLGLGLVMVQLDKLMGRWWG